MKNLRESIMEDIKKGHVTMKPRLYFVLKLFTLTSLIGAALVVTVFIFNFISFSIRMSGNDALLGFGSHGVRAFLHFFPWRLLIADGVLIFLLQWLLRHFRVGYAIPILYLVGAIALGGGLVGYLLDHTTLFNDRMHENRGHLPGLMRSFYDGARRFPPKGSGICRCTIRAIDGTKLIVEDARAGTSSLTIYLPENDRHATTTNLSVGDVVFIAGEEIDGIIRAYGVRKEKDYRHTRSP